MSVDLLVVGLGYVGLPLAREACRSGMTVVGLDIDPLATAALNAGTSHIDDLSDQDLQKMREQGFVATTDEARISEATAVVICVPTPLAADGGPDLGPVEAATAAVARHLRAGMLVVLESTTYPGTTQEVLRPAFEAGGMKAGHDFNLAFSPERVDPGNPVYNIRNTPKVVGGVTAACTQRAANFYEQFIDQVIRAQGSAEAETAKLLENTYRHINIALVNEMSRFCHELDINLWDVIRLASTKPFGFQPFYPGPGVGGHCIPIDPNYLSHNVRTRLGYPFRFVELAQEINATMPQYVARRAQDILNDASLPTRGSQVLLLGVTYKANISDRRESPAVPLAKALLDLGAQLSFHDPYVTDWAVLGTSIPRATDLLPAVQEADLVILVQAHRVYEIDRLAELARRFFDTRGVSTSPKAILL